MLFSRMLRYMLISLASSTEKQFFNSVYLFRSLNLCLTSRRMWGYYIFIFPRNSYLCLCLCVSVYMYSYRMWRPLIIDYDIGYRKLALFFFLN